MSTGARWAVRPRAGIGPVGLGATIDEIRRKLGQGDELQKLPGQPPAITYPGVGLTIYPDRAGIAREVEAFDPADVELDGRLLIGQSLSDVLRGVTSFARGPEGAESVELGVRLWAPERTVVSIVVFDPEKPLAVPTNR